MKWAVVVVLAAACSASLASTPILAAPVEPLEIAGEPQVARARDLDSPRPEPAKVLEDTTWIADWSFDGASCNDTGWVKQDLRILNDGSNYWKIEPWPGFAGNAAVLRKHDLSWARDGYGNNWDYSIVCKYRGAGSSLSLDYSMDSEPGFDFVTIEADSAGASESRVDYTIDPSAGPSAYRTQLLSLDGHQSAAIASLALPDFAVPATTHEVYIRFASDGGYSDEDGLYPSADHLALAVDNIMITGSLSYTENFDTLPIDPNITLVNSAAATPFGLWPRLFPHVTDNDQCLENTTCAWIFTDPGRVAFYADMAFGPGSAVIRNWVDNVIVSPWVSLAGTPSATGTVISYRRFPGNNFTLGRIVQNWSVRSMFRIDNTDTSTPGDSIDAVGPWAHASSWNSLSIFSWITSIGDMSASIDPAALAVQVRVRVSDWQYVAQASPPSTLNPGPGPYVDRVRIGRRILTGPVFDVGIDARSQAQDCFPTERNSILPGEHFSPGTDVFGTGAFSRSGDLWPEPPSTLVVTGDSITIRVEDVRDAGGVTHVRWYGAITAGPHFGKSPAPYAVSANGFFEVTPDSARGSSGSVVANTWFVDLDDTYFRGGDRLLYFWSAVDAGSGRASLPQGITPANFPPSSPAAAELATGGLFEVDFLPRLDWSSGYLGRIAADAHGDLDPTPAEIAETRQASCILYYAAGFGGGLGRFSGDANRTSFMYTLDRLGYRDRYDVYDHTGYGNTNNQLGGRASVEQCSGYALIIHDTGRGPGVNLPDGGDFDSEKVNQCQWYRDYLAQGLTSAVGIANLWLIGEDNAFEKASNPLISTDVGLASVVENQSLAVSPDVVGQNSFTFTTGGTAAFAGDVFTLDGGCPAVRDYDAALNSGTSLITHRYSSNGTTGSGAIVMNKNTTLHWNTIWMGFGWFDIVVPVGGSPASETGAPATRLARKIMDAALPIDCHEAEDPTDTPGPGIEAVPTVTALHPNVPNPFNPTTEIRFDLARTGYVRLRIFDAAGRLVATLVDGPMAAGFGKRALWNGLDASGRRAPSGVYFSQLVTPDATAARKMILLQ